MLNTRWRNVLVFPNTSPFLLRQSFSVSFHFNTDLFYVCNLRDMARPTNILFHDIMSYYYYYYLNLYNTFPLECFAYACV